MHYSVIRTGNKQYIVQAGDELHVELIDGKEGDTIEFDTLLRVQDATVEFGEPTLTPSAKGEVVDTVRGTKKEGIKYKPGGYRRKFGHRQQYSKVKILEV